VAGLSGSTGDNQVIIMSISTDCIRNQTPHICESYNPAVPLGYMLGIINFVFKAIGKILVMFPYQKRQDEPPLLAVVLH
jgi:hypothetical protein